MVRFTDGLGVRGGILMLIVVTALLIASCGKTAMSSQNITMNSADANKYFIESLRLEKFKGRGIKIIRALEEKQAFTRYLIEYDSQGLGISGMMNVPKGEGPFPVVILNHGHYDPIKFSIGLGFKSAADIFAENGYVAVGADFRNNGNSDKGEDFFEHIGSLHDVLYLVEAVKELPYVRRERIGMWGYSGGGWLTLKALVISNDIKAAALFGSMSMDDRDNYYALMKWHPEALEGVVKILGTPDENPDNYARLSTMGYLKDISAKVIIHHGVKDEATPFEWSVKLREALVKEGKIVEFYPYSMQEHVLKGKAWDRAMQKTVNFFDRFLKG
ncbi:MAG: prolyl oligopeptidase family serine peptidase [Nitrospirota bacterium]